MDKIEIEIFVGSLDVTMSYSLIKIEKGVDPARFWCYRISKHIFSKLNMIIKLSP